MLRRLLCRWFHLTPNEAVPVVPAPTMWDDLWEIKDTQIVWPRMVLSDVWQKDMEPYFKKSLLHTFVRLSHERDPEQVRRLQERALLINEWLEQPRIAMQRDEAMLNNAFGSGQQDRLKVALERANTHGRR